MSYRSGLLTCTLLVSLAFSALSQQAAIDSLQRMLRTQRANTQPALRTSTLTALCTAMRTWDLRQSAEYGRQAVALSASLTSELIAARAHTALGYTLATLHDNSSAAQHLSKGLSLAGRKGAESLMAQALRGLGKVQRNLGNGDSARVLFEMALPLAEAGGDAVDIAGAMIDLGILRRTQGQSASAHELFTEALHLSESANDTAGIARALIMIGDIARRKGDNPAALPFFTRSLRLSESQRNRHGIATALYLIGSTYLNRGEYETALPYFRRSVAVYDTLGNKSGGAVALTYLGHIHNIQGRYTQALDYYRRGLALNEELGNKYLMIGSLLSIGDVQFQQSDFEQAMISFQRSLRLCEEVGENVLKASALIHIGRIHAVQGRYNQAIDSYRASIAVFEAFGGGSGISIAMNYIADIYTEQGNYVQALDYYQRGMKQFEEEDDKQRIAQTLNSIGFIQMKQARYDEAMDSFRESLRLREALEEQAGISESLTSIGAVLIEQGRYDSAIVYGTRAQGIAKTIGAIAQAKEATILLSDAYARKSDFFRAYEFHRAYTVYKDSLINEENVKSINEMTAKYEADKREQRISLLEKDKALQRLAFRRQQEELLRQQLESRQKQQMLDLLGKEKEIQDLTLTNANVELEKQRIENARKRNEVVLLKKDRELQSSLLERETLTRNVFVAGVFILLVISGLLLHRYRYRKRTTEQLTDTLKQLRVTQTQLIHAEKMVTLGEMTAGLAHEIKNPLNFVTNFSGVANDMLTDLEHAENEEARQAVLADLRRNLTKIQEHGYRADTIIQGMMLHARGGVGELVRTDINALVEDAVNLAYHGMRATHLSFNVTLIKNYHPSRLELNIIPQAISRVLLNLLNNAMYVVRENHPPASPASVTGSDAPPAGEGPTIWVSTAVLGQRVEIRVRDNGPGIPPDIQQKIFEPFFTTKPSGEGTGLGLSMSYDIIVNGHGGELTCSNTGSGAEFVIVLPAEQDAAPSVR